jgi:hypothetical protein
MLPGANAAAPTCVTANSSSLSSWTTSSNMMPTRLWRACSSASEASGRAPPTPRRAPVVAERMQ